MFVGYGVVAPEYGWDDYKGADLRGKTMVMLINDPAISDPNNPGKLDDTMFKGRTMTYYGRWTYKFEIAAQQGAAANFARLLVMLAFAQFLGQAAPLHEFLEPAQGCADRLAQGRLLGSRHEVLEQDTPRDAVDRQVMDEQHQPARPIGAAIG